MSLALMLGPTGLASLLSLDRYSTFVLAALFAPPAAISFYSIICELEPADPDARSQSRPRARQSLMLLGAAAVAAMSALIERDLPSAARIPTAAGLTGGLGLTLVLAWLWCGNGGTQRLDQRLYAWMTRRTRNYLVVSLAVGVLAAFIADRLDPAPSKHAFERSIAALSSSHANSASLDRQAQAFITAVRRADLDPVERRRLLADFASAVGARCTACKDRIEVALLAE